MHKDRYMKILTMKVNVLAASILAVASIGFGTSRISRADSGRSTEVMVEIFRQSIMLTPAQFEGKLSALDGPSRASILQCLRKIGSRNTGPALKRAEVCDEINSRMRARGFTSNKCENDPLDWVMWAGSLESAISGRSAWSSTQMGLSVAIWHSLVAAVPEMKSWIDVAIELSLPRIVSGVGCG